MPSTVIKNIQYDAGTATLRVEFVSGMIYEYQEVPESVYLGLKTSGAKGVYLNQQVKGRYAYKKIT